MGDGPNAKDQFDLLAQNKSAIEVEFPGENLSWDRKEGRLAASVFVECSCDPYRLAESTPEREALFAWVTNNIGGLRQVAKAAFD